MSHPDSTMVNSSSTDFAEALLDALADVIPADRIEELRAIARAIRPEPQWTRPRPVKAWANVFGCSRQTMARRLRDGYVRAKPFGVEGWMLDVADVPAEHLDRFSAG